MIKLSIYKRNIFRYFPDDLFKTINFLLILNSCSSLFIQEVEQKKVALQKTLLYLESKLNGQLPEPLESMYILTE